MKEAQNIHQDHHSQSTELGLDTELDHTFLNKKEQGSNKKEKFLNKKKNNGLKKKIVYKI